MSAQLSIAYKPAYEAREIHERRLSVLRTTVEHLGRKEVAFELDISGSQLSDALNERDRKRWAAEWTDVVKQMLANRRADDVARDLLHQLLDIDVLGTGFAVDPADVMTPEEEAAAYRAALLKTDGGKAIVDRIRKRSR